MRSQISCIIFLIFGLIFNFSVSAQENVTKDFSDQIDFANGLFKREFYDMAAEEYQKILRDSTSAEGLEDVYFGYAETLFFQKKYSEAEKSFRDFIDQYPKSEKISIAHARVGQTLYLQKNNYKALISFQDVDISKLDDHLKQSTLYYLAKILSGMDQADKAKEHYQKLLEEFDQGEFSNYAKLELAQLIHADDPVRALEYLNQIPVDLDDESFVQMTGYKRAKLYIQTQKYEEAENRLKDLIAFDQDSFQFREDAISDLLNVLYQQEKYDEIVDLYKREESFFESKVEKINHFLVVAQAYEKSEKSDQAFEILNSLLSLEGLTSENIESIVQSCVTILTDQEDPEQLMSFLSKPIVQTVLEPDYSLFIKAESFYRQKKYEEAVDAYEMILLQHQESPHILKSYYGLGYAQLALNNKKEAAEYFYTFAKQSDPSELREEVFYNAIVICFDEKYFDLAEQYSKEFIETFSESDKAPQLKFFAAEFSLKNEEFESAIEQYEAILSEEKEFEYLENIYFSLGYAYQALGDFEKALTAYNKIEKTKDVGGFYYSALKNKALIALKQEKNDQAVKLFEELFETFEQNDIDAETKLWLVEYYFERNDYSKILDLIKTVELDEVDSKLKSHFFYYKAVVSFKTEDFENAYAFYQELEKIKDHPYKTETIFGIGLSLIGLDRLEEAESFFENLLRESLDDHTIKMRSQYELARIYQLTSRLDKAAKLYMMVGILYDDQKFVPESLYQAGTIFEKSGESSKAKKAFQELSRRFPNHELVQKLKIIGGKL